MNGEQVTFSVFTKPWKTLSLGELGALVRGFGFDAVELPVRPGYQVQPDTMETGLKEAVRAFADEGIVVKSVAAPTDGVRPGFTGELIAACAENDIPVIRVFPFIRPDEPRYGLAIHIPCSAPLSHPPPSPGRRPGRCRRGTEAG